MKIKNFSGREKLIITQTKQDFINIRHFKELSLSIRNMLSVKLLMKKCACLEENFKMGFLMGCALEKLLIRKFRLEYFRKVISMMV
jgi:hypothetical protein